MHREIPCFCAKPDHAAEWFDPLHHRDDVDPFQVLAHLDLQTRAMITDESMVQRAIDLSSSIGNSKFSKEYFLNMCEKHFLQTRAGWQALNL